MEKHYSIDPGLGKKMDGCPYSIYEDGHDVKNYIIPPKGHVFIGFKFVPLPNNQVYDGKLVAQFEKSPIKDRLSTNIGKILIPTIIAAVIGLIVLLVFSVFNDPKPKRPKQEPKKPEPEVVATPIDTVAATVVDDTIDSNDSLVSDEDEGVILDLTQQPEKQDIETETEAQKAPVNDSNAQFKQTFWELIHQGDGRMDSYHELYVGNKNKVEGEEYDYLRFSILKDTNYFIEWSRKLRRIPASEREKINTINELVRKLNEIK